LHGIELTIKNMKVPADFAMGPGSPGAAGIVVVESFQHLQLRLDSLLMTFGQFFDDKRATSEQGRGNTRLCGFDGKSLCRFRIESRRRIE
jgi:hypothetical protein